MDDPAWGDGIPPLPAEMLPMNIEQVFEDFFEHYDFTPNGFFLRNDSLEFSNREFPSTFIQQQGGFYDSPDQAGLNEALVSNEPGNVLNQSGILRSPQAPIEQPSIHVGLGEGNRSRMKRKSRSRFSDEEWETMKEAIHEIYIKRNRTKQRLIETMATAHNFHATEKMYSDRLKLWGFNKNKTKANGGVTALTESDDPRQRPMQRRPQKKTKTSGSLYISVKKSATNLTASLTDETSSHQEKMFHAIDTLVKKLFGSGKNGWTATDMTNLDPPPGTFCNSKTWELLTIQCESTLKLSRTGLLSRVTVSLNRVFQGLNEAAKQCQPWALVYFWEICVALTQVRLYGTLKMEMYPLLRVFLKYLKHSFSRSLGGNSVVDFLESLNHILVTSPKGFRFMLGQGYKKAIDVLGEMIGTDHAVVLKMMSHYTKHWRIKHDIRVHEHLFSARYQDLIADAKAKFGATGEQTISLLYDYTNAMSLGEIDPEVVKELRDQTAELCRAQTPLKCNLTSRAFGLSTEVLANMSYKKERHLSFKYMDEAIEILQHGDQECRIWATSLSKRLCQWYKTSRHPEGVKLQRQKTIDIRSYIEQDLTAKPIFRQTRCRIGEKPGRSIRAQQYHARGVHLRDLVANLDS